MSNILGRRNMIRTMVCAATLLTGTNSAFALSAGCTAHNITQTTGVLVGFPLVNRNFSSTNVFEAGEVITFSAAHGPTQVVNITSFSITETTTATAILNGAGNTGATYTIPADGNYFFNVRISATNPGPNAGVINYVRTCVVGVAPPPPPATGGGATTTTTTTATVAASPALLLFQIAAAAIASRDEQEKIQYSNRSILNRSTPEIDYSIGIRRAAQLLAELPSILKKLDAADEQDETNRIFARQTELERENEEIAKKIAAFRARIPEEREISFGGFANSVVDNDELNLILRELSKLEEIRDSNNRELEQLINPVHDVRGEVGGVVVLAYAPGEKTQRPTGIPEVFRLSGNNRNVAFDLNVLRAFATSPAGLLRKKRDDLDIWLTGRLAILGDSSAANRDGYLGNINAGIAKKLNDKFAVSADVTARFGQLNVNASNSTTDVLTTGLALSSVMALTQSLQAGIGGSFEHGWFDSNYAGATGSYNSNTYAIFGFLGGTYNIGELTLQPSANVIYSFSNIGGYTDSVGVVVRGQSTEFGQAGTGLTVSKKIGGRGMLLYWQPYVNGRVNFAFQQNSSFQLRPGLLINESQFNGSVGAGAQFTFTNGATGTLSASYQSSFGSGFNSLNLAVGLRIPLK